MPGSFWVSELFFFRFVAVPARVFWSYDWFCYFFVDLSGEDEKRNGPRSRCHNSCFCLYSCGFVNPRRIYIVAILRTSGITLLCRPHISSSLPILGWICIPWICHVPSHQCKYSLPEASHCFKKEFFSLCLAFLFGADYAIARQCRCCFWDCQRQLQSRFGPSRHPCRSRKKIGQGPARCATFDAHSIEQQKWLDHDWIWPLFLLRIKGNPLPGGYVAKSGKKEIRKERQNEWFVVASSGTTGFAPKGIFERCSKKVMVIPPFLLPGCHSSKKAGLIGRVEKKFVAPLSLPSHSYI